MPCCMSPYRSDYIFTLFWGASHFHALACTPFRDSRWTLQKFPCKTICSRHFPVTCSPDILSCYYLRPVASIWIISHKPQRGNFSLLKYFPRFFASNFFCLPKNNISGVNPMLSILARCYPLQIVCAIICPIAIYVVYKVFIFWISHKSFSDEPMNKRCGYFAVLA